ncbi:hypothetical protein OG216_19255 [Streptomycetaceae bacterium NBC_01309]
MPGVPGQRAAQQNVRAATAAQRALGQAVAADGGTPPRPIGVAMLNGRYFTVDLSLGAKQVLIPREPVPLTARPDEGHPRTPKEGAPDGDSADC